MEHKKLFITKSTLIHTSGRDVIVIKNKKSIRKIILVFGILLLITSSVIFLYGNTQYPDVERNMAFTVEAENTTWITLRNIQYTNDLQGFFEVEEGNLDFIITSQAWSHSWGLIALGLLNQITGIYSLENVSEDHFDLQLNSIDDATYYSEEWYLVFDNRNYTQEKNIELHYSLHPRARDAFNVAALVLFMISLGIFTVLVAFKLGIRRYEEIDTKSNESPPSKTIPQIIKVTCPRCGVALQMKGSGDSISSKCSNCNAVFTVKAP
jgi:hypothetical protein